MKKASLRKRARREKQPARPARPVVVIYGDSPLVEEYVRLCSDKGYDVVFQWNAPPHPLPPFEVKSVRRSSIIPKSASLALELTTIDLAAKRKNLVRLDRALSADRAVVSTSITVTATEQASWIRHRYRLVGVGLLPSFADRKLVEVAPTLYTPRATLDVVQHFWRSLDKEIEVVQDRVGLILPRILCQIINEAAFAVMEDVASPRDIDSAMKLGSNYPYGPLEWADRIGIRNVCAVLSALQQDLQEDRYRCSPLLRQLALAGSWWKETQ